MAMFEQFRDSLVADRERRIQQSRTANEQVRIVTEQTRTLGQQVFSQTVELLKKSPDLELRWDNTGALIPPLTPLGVAYIILSNRFSKTTLLEEITGRVLKRPIETADGSVDVSISANLGNPAKARSVDINIKGTSKLSLYKDGGSSFEVFGEPKPTLALSRSATVPELQAHLNLLQQLGAEGPDIDQIYWRDFLGPKVESLTSKRPLLEKAGAQLITFLGGVAGGDGLVHYASLVFSQPQENENLAALIAARATEGVLGIGTVFLADAWKKRIWRRESKKSGPKTEIS